MRIGEHQVGTLFVQEQARDEPAVVQRQAGQAVGRVDVAVGVEHVLEEPFDSPGADAVELGPDPRRPLPPS